MDADVYLPGSPTCDTPDAGDSSQRLANTAFVQERMNTVLADSIAVVAYGNVAGRMIGSIPLTADGSAPYETDDHFSFWSHVVFRYSGDVAVDSECTVSMGTTEGADDILPPTPLTGLVNNTKQIVLQLTGLGAQIPPGKNVYVNVTSPTSGGGTSPGRGLFVVTLFGSYVF